MGKITFFSNWSKEYGLQFESIIFSAKNVSNTDQKYTEIKSKSMSAKKLVETV